MLEASGRPAGLSPFRRPRCGVGPSALAGFPDSDFTLWIGIFAPVKTPRDIVGKLNRKTVKVLQTKAVAEKLATLGAEPMITTPTEFDAYFQDQVSMILALTKAANIKPE